jgi:hypothetical protein
MVPGKSQMRNAFPVEINKSGQISSIAAATQAVQKIADSEHLTNKFISAKRLVDRANGCTMKADSLLHGPLASRNQLHFSDSLRTAKSFDVQQNLPWQIEAAIIIAETDGKRYCTPISSKHGERAQCDLIRGVNNDAYRSVHFYFHVPLFFDRIGQCSAFTNTCAD